MKVSQIILVHISFHIQTDFMTLQATFEAQKLLLAEQQNALAAKAGALQEQVTELQKVNSLMFQA
jgi:hypothetical protein